MRVKASDEHVLCRPRPELEHDVFGLLARPQLSVLHVVPLHVLVKAVDDHEPMALPKLALPEALEAVAPCVIGARVLRVVERRFSRRPALVTHRLDEPFAILDDQHRGIPPREDAPVPRLQFGTLQVLELRQGRCDFSDATR